MAECVEQAAAALARGIDKLVMENKVKSDEKKL